MLGGGKNIKDNQRDQRDTGSSPLGITVKDNTQPLSYTKTNKLIAALYMVTDIMDKDEPLRNKLRTLGTGIISDTYISRADVLPKISEIMSFLDIAGVVNLISEMNANILRKEFIELKTAIEESLGLPKRTYAEVNLFDFFNSEALLPSANISPTRIGVQKGSTLMKALGKFNVSDRAMSDRKVMSDTRPNGHSSGRGATQHTNHDFDLIKKQRRFEIVSIIKNNPGGATITDIRTHAVDSLISCGEKTLQRELIGMLKDGVLKKTGEKRWSRYFLS